MANILSQNIWLSTLLDHSVHRFQTEVTVTYFSDTDLSIFFRLEFGWYFQPEDIVSYIDEQYLLIVVQLVFDHYCKMTLTVIYFDAIDLHILVQLVRCRNTYDVC